MAAARSGDPDVRHAAILDELRPEFPDVVALDAKAAECIAAGHVLPGLVCWERALFLRQHYLGNERLNACAILSQLGRHDKALSLAQTALILLQGQAMDAVSCGEGGVTAVASDIFEAQAVAHHNIAVEEEFLGKTLQSLHSYRRAALLAATHCGASHPLTMELTKSLDAAEAALAQKKTQKMFKNGRDIKAKAVYGHTPVGKAQSPTKSQPFVPKATRTAYGVKSTSQSSTQVLQDELLPTKILNMAQFEDAALTDNFDVNSVYEGALYKEAREQDEAATSDVGMAGQNIVMLLTPRREAPDENVDGSVSDTTDVRDATESTGRQDEKAATSERDDSPEGAKQCVDARDTCGAGTDGGVDLGEIVPPNDMPDDVGDDLGNAQAKENDMQDELLAASKALDADESDYRPDHDDAGDDSDHQHDDGVGDPGNDLSDDETKLDNDKQGDGRDDAKSDISQEDDA
ncbi:hypothetical protein DYB32_001381 [Aphanomyces invadans]|uniref:Uncharacterized protein n=1 Tax=Aphanomyces invadans TaxID=157072 RepID=A0A3R7AEE3_9STRA|nr:hypothetical protein DYB32_001381 [Aphanomyces invadans]